MHQIKRLKMILFHPREKWRAKPTRTNKKSPRMGLYYGLFLIFL